MPILYTTPHKKVNENFVKFSLTNQGKIIMCGPKRKKYVCYLLEYIDS